MSGVSGVPGLAGPAGLARFALSLGVGSMCRHVLHVLALLRAVFAVLRFVTNISSRGAHPTAITVPSCDLCVTCALHGPRPMEGRMLMRTVRVSVAGRSLLLDALTCCVLLRLAALLLEYCPTLAGAVGDFGHRRRLDVLVYPSPRKVG